MDAPDRVRLREDQKVVVAAHLAVPGIEAGAAIAFLVELELLDHGAHGTVEHQDALGGELAQTPLGGRHDNLSHCLRSLREEAARPQEGEAAGELQAATPANGRWRRPGRRDSWCRSESR